MVHYFITADAERFCTEVVVRITLEAYRPRTPARFVAARQMPHERYASEDGRMKVRKRHRFADHGLHYGAEVTRTREGRKRC